MGGSTCRARRMWVLSTACCRSGRLLGIRQHPPQDPWGRPWAEEERSASEGPSRFLPTVSKKGSSAFRKSMATSRGPLASLLAATGANRLGVLLQMVGQILAALHALLPALSKTPMTLT